MLTPSATQGTVFCKRYGHNTLYALRGSDGVLCYTWWAWPETQAIALFTDPKTAKSWRTKAVKAGWVLAVEVQPIQGFAAELKPTINPAEDEQSIALILKRSFYRDNS